MRWFSHRRRSGRRHNCILVYWRMCWRGPLPRLPRPHPFVDVLRSDSANRHILECGDRGVGLWPPNSNWEEIFVQRTKPPSFIVLRLIVRKSSCWQTNKHTPPKTYTSLRYATLVGNNLMYLDTLREEKTLLLSFFSTFSLQPGWVRTLSIIDCWTSGVEWGRKQIFAGRWKWDGSLAGIHRVKWRHRHIVPLSCRYYSRCWF